MSMKIYFFILFISTISYSQQGKILILDKSSKEIIPYASIKFINTTEGTYSNEKGVFNINSGIDSIEISCLGYQTIKISTNEIQTTTYLTPTTTLLKAVELKNQSAFEILDKKKSENYIGLGSFVNNTINLAKRFDFNNTVVLKSVQLDILNNQTEKIALLKIYDIDSNHKPLKNILEHHIYYKILPDDKILSIDLTDYQILLKNKSYFIVLELFNLNAKKGDSPLKVGFYKSKKNGYTLLNSSSSINNEWVSIKIPNKKYEYNLNLYLTVERIN